MNKRLPNINGRKLVAILYCLSLSVVVQASPPLAFYFDKDQYPYAYSEQGTAKGLYPEIVRACANISGTKVVLKAVPWKRALLSGLDTHKAVAGPYKTQRRLEQYYYSEPIYEEKIVVVSSLSWQRTFKNINDLKSYRIGVASGWSYGQTLDKAFASGQYLLEYASSASLVLKKLLIGRSDLALGSELHVIAFLKTNNAHTTHRIHDEVLGQQYVYVAFGKSPENFEHLKIFNRSLSQLKRQGQYQRLLQAFKKNLQQ